MGLENAQTSPSDPLPDTALVDAAPARRPTPALASRQRAGENLMAPATRGQLQVVIVLSVLLAIGAMAVLWVL